MPSPIARRLGGLLAFAGLAAALIFVVVPWLASTRIVRDRIAMELSELSGYSVVLGAAPDVEIWPVFRATLRDVRFWAGDGAAEPVIVAERLETDLSALAALRGDVVFDSVRFMRPSIRMSRDGLDLIMPRSDGRFARSIAAARALAANSSARRSNEGLPAERLGRFEVVDGRLTLVDRAGGEDEIMTGLNGTVDWPAMNGSVTSSLNAVWRGELVRMDLSSPQPLMLLAGAHAPLTVNVTSAPLELGFEGRATLSSASFVDGELRLSAPSLRRILEWAGSDISTGSAIGSISLQSDVNGLASRLKLSDAVLTVDGNPGDGTLEAELGGAVPAISGTLAFDTIDLGAILAAFSNITPDSWARYGTIDNGIARQLSLDLRLSSRRATAGSIALNDVAATAQVKSGLSAFDISDATAFGGTVQAGIRIDGDENGNQVEIRLRGSDIDMGAFAKTVQANHLMPVARANLSVSLKGQGRNWYDVVRTAQGNVLADFGPGAIAGIDLEKFAVRAAQGEFFPLHDVGGATLSFRGIKFHAAVEDGVANLDKLELQTAGHLISLEGLVPLPGRGLALQGRLEPVPAAGAAPMSGPASFFVGGSWDAPFISPILPFLGAP